MSSEPNGGMVKLSVITPSYNYGAWIAEALTSVERQHSPAYEHIVIDDGSSDDSVDVARSHPSSPVVIPQENVGLAETLNRLVGLASGEWIGWLNADDFYLKGTFDTLSAILESDSSLDVLVGDTVFIDKLARVQRLLPAHRITGQVTKHFGMTAGTSAFFVRRAALEAVSFRRGTKFLMDKWLFWQLWEMGARFGYVPTPLGAMRRHEQQESQLQRDLGAAEKAEFRQAARIPGRGVGRTLSKGWGRTLHLGYKITDGGFRNEWRFRVHRGVDARWWLPSAEDRRQLRSRPPMTALRHSSRRGNTRAWGATVGAG